MSGQRIVVSPDAFGQFKVRELGEADYFLGSATPTALKSPKCHIILFYEPGSTDPQLIEIWNTIAQTTGGPVIAAVNTSARGEVMEAFLNTSQDPDHPLNDYAISGIPTILVYRNRWPQAFYNGELSYDALKKWILVLACKPGYRERDSTFTGIEAVQADEFVEDTRIENYPYPTSSRDYTSNIGQRAGTRGGEVIDINEDIPEEEVEEPIEEEVVSEEPVEEEEQPVEQEEVPIEETMEETSVEESEPVEETEPAVTEETQDIGFASE